MFWLLALAAPPPQCYSAEVLSFAPKPVLSHVDGSSAFAQAFNPSWVEASPATGGKQGLLVRSQNCSAIPGGPCVECQGTGANASVLAFSELRGADGPTTTPSFAPVGKNDVVFGPHDDDDLRGTEDPRIAYDHATRTYYMFYTCWDQQKRVHLCLATTDDPTSPGGFTRHGSPFPGNHKSAALLIRESAPHFLISGAGQIFIAQSGSLLNWTLGAPFINQTLWGNPNVEAGPPPMRLTDGNYMFFFNSWGGKDVPQPGYEPAWAVLDGADPTRILASAPRPLWHPTDQPWMAGVKPYTCNVPQVSFVEAAHPEPGTDDAFRTYFGGADAVVGTAVVGVQRVPGVACS